MAFLSSYNDNENALKPGDKSPEIQLISGSNEKLEKAKIRIVNFWSPKDPKSRIANKEISKYIEENPGNNTEFISICTDKDNSLAKEVLKWDGVSNNGNHLLYSDVDSKVFKNFRINNSHKTFLIDKNGKIMKVGSFII